MALEKEPSSSPQNSGEPRGLLYILAAFFAGSWIVSIFSRWRTPNHETAYPNDTQDYTSEEGERRQYISPSPLRVVVDSPIPSITPPEQRKTEKKKKNRLQRLMALINFLTLVAVSVYACVAVQQRNEMKRQTNAFERTLRDSEAAQSASLVIKEFKVEMVSGRKPFTINVHYTIVNAGHSVASQIEWETGGGTCNLATSDCVPPKKALIPNPSPLGPSLAPDPIQPPLSGEYSEGGGNPDDILSGRLIFTASMTVSWKDIFGKSYAIYECRTFNPAQKKFVISSAACPEVVQKNQ